LLPRQSPLPWPGCKKKAVDPFPASGAVAGWEKTSDTRTFAAKDLWQYIDGDAEQYISAGVVSTSTSDYKYQGQLEAVVDVYTMGDAAGARKILETPARPATPRPCNWAMRASRTRRASSSAKARTWCASLPMSPRPARSRLCLRWRTAWKRSCNRVKSRADRAPRGNGMRGGERGTMKSRRDFLKDRSNGSRAAWRAEQAGLAAMLDQREAGKSKVVVARDAALHGRRQLDEKRVLDLLDRAIAAYTGHDKPVEAWKRIVPVGKVIGLKVNGLGGKGISTHAALVMAVCERLQQAGVKPGNIMVWDRNARTSKPAA
jgi:hypothetical protein